MLNLVCYVSLCEGLRAGAGSELYCTCRLLRFANDCNKEDYCYYLLGTHKLECIGYDGRGRRTITESAPYPFGLAFHDGVLYWTDWERRLTIYLFMQPPLPVNIKTVIDIHATVYSTGHRVVQNVLPIRKRFN